MTVEIILLAVAFGVACFALGVAVGIQRSRSLRPSEAQLQRLEDIVAQGAVSSQSRRPVSRYELLGTKAPFDVELGEPR